MGVFSQSEDKPIKTAGFALVNRDFEGAEKYADWKFVYNPAALQVPVPQQLPPGTPAPPSQPAPAAGPPAMGGMQPAPVR
jgi:hypothetical protein